MVALSSNYMVPDVDEPTKEDVQAQLENEMIPLRRKLADERKRNHDLQEIVVRGMGKHCIYTSDNILF